MKDYDDIRLRRYLLDQLTQGEKDQVEQDLLVDDDLFEAAEAVEGDLLDAYARGELTAEERESIVRRLATSPRGQSHLALVKDLATVSREEFREDRTPPVVQEIRRPSSSPKTRQRRPIARFAIAASLAGVMAAGLLTWNNLPVQGAVVEIAFTLDDTHLRSGGGERQTATLSPADTLRIKLRNLEKENYPDYEVVVSRAGEEVTRERLKSGDTSVEVPAEKLPEGWYELVVQGLPEEGMPDAVIRSEFEVVAE